MEKVRREAGQHAPADMPVESPQESAAPISPRRQVQPSLTSEGDEALREEFESLRNVVAELKQDLTAARAEFTTTADALKRELDELNRQLGN
jgi:hypothetical protein